MSPKKNKTRILFLSLAVIGLFALVVPVWAQNAPAAQNPSGIGPAGRDALDFLGETAKRGGLTENPSAATDPTDIVAAIINTVLGLTGIIFFAQMFYAGFRWMTSSGSEEIIKESKKTIFSSIVGIIIAFSAFVVTNFVINRIQGVGETTATVVPAAPVAPSVPPTTP